MLNKIETYSYSKAVQLLAFDSDSQNIIRIGHWQQLIFTDEILDAIMSYVDYNFENKFLEEPMKSNLFCVIDYIRNNRNYKNDIEKKDLYEIYNYLITTLHKSSSVNHYDFYIEELTKRQDYPKYMKLLKKITKMYIDNIKGEIHDSLSTDYNVLLSHSNIIDNGDFINICEYYAANPDYIDSINAFLNECPSVFEDEKFKSRTLYILENSKNMLLGKKSCFEADYTIKQGVHLAIRTDTTIKKIKSLRYYIG